MRNSAACICVLLFSRGSFASDCDDHSFNALYKSHQLFELRDAVNKGSAPVLYQGIIACAFNHLAECEKKLESVIKTAPLSEDARQARTTLAAVYFRSGRYREALMQANAMLAASPSDPVKDSQPLAAALARLPDQSVTRQKPSRVKLKAWGEDLAVPVTVNGRPATYAFDTGSFAVLVSLSEAIRIGLKLYDTDPNAKVNGLSIRVGLAHHFDVGNFRFKNVAFIVFPDDQAPFNEMPEGERGIIGLPTLLAFQKFSWGWDGFFELGSQDPKNLSEPNISFDEQFVLAQVGFRNSKLTFGLDTGGETTTLEPRFTRSFPEIVRQFGKKDWKKENEIGSSREIESIVLPELELRIGGFPAVLRPAHILMDAAAEGCHYGNLGMDLMKQSKRTTIDFESMTITMK